MTLAERLKMARELLGYTQKEMAKKINTNVQTWQVYEAGSSVPGGKVLESLVRLGLNVNWILTGKGEMTLDSENNIEFVCSRIKLIVEVYQEFLIDRKWRPPANLIARQIADIYREVSINSELRLDKVKIRKYIDPEYEETASE